MITPEAVKAALDRADAWEDGCRAAELPLSPDHYRQNAEMHELRCIFSRLSISDENYRAKLIEYSLPDAPGIAPYGDYDIEYAISSGLSNAVSLGRFISRFASAAPRSVLDFGCGSGRILRFFAQFAPGPAYSGCEVNGKLVTYLGETFPEASFFEIESEPPMPVDDDSFDVVYGWSIFSHYAEKTHLAWLQELARVLQPGGLLLVTTQSTPLLDRFEKEERFITRLRDSGADYGDIRHSFEERGFAFFESNADNAEKFGIDVKTFGHAFISHDYIKREWTQDFDLLHIEPEIIVNWQDLIVLRKRA